MDALSLITDEVALEGLDGITLPSLWIRLENRQPKFPLKLDEPTKELLWRSLTIDPDMEFYQNPQERDDVVLFDRFDDIDPETGIEIKQSFSETFKDIYPIHILENTDGIQGSCEFFTQRTDVTKHIRSKSFTPLLNLQEALQRYGRKLVVVASQKVRFRSLIGSESDPDLKLKDDSYCVLERVGRARWQGELQKDLHGHSFKIDARKLHYLRISLVKHGLVTMQSHCTRLKTGQQLHSILLLLKRFHINRRSKYDILMEHVSNFLQRSPGQITSIITLKAQLNVGDNTLKRVIQYMKSAKLVETHHYPLEDLDPSIGPCVYKKGHKVLVRCLRLLKPYSKKSIAEDDTDEDNDDEDEDYAEAGRALPAEGRIMEQDMLSQAYHLVLSCGSKGIAQSGIKCRMNIGKLEARTICRRLEREGVIKGFMEDEGRQRTTKFISHKWASGSDQLQLFVKEQERNKLLYLSDPQSSTAPATSSPSPSAVKAGGKSPPSPRKQKVGKKGRTRGVEEDVLVRTQDAAEEGLRKKVKPGRKARAKRKAAEKENTEESPPENPVTQASPGEQQDPAEEENEPSSCPTETVPQTDHLNPENNNLVEATKGEKYFERSHQTYRLLRRKNLIVEAVRNFKVIEGLFQLQKMINDEEKQGGFSSKCCKKTITRLIYSLSREGLLKFYRTTVIQDGVSKKVELVVHPSIRPNDEIVSQAIEQVRFKISSSYTAARSVDRPLLPLSLQHAEEKDGEQLSEKSRALKLKSKVDKKRTGSQREEEFKPVPVRGLGKRVGFLPKMPRLRVIHTFIWYLLHGHPQRHDAATPPGDKDAERAPPAQEVTSSPAEDADAPKDERERSDLKVTSHLSLPWTVYMDEDSWRRFVPPVRVLKDFGSGWAMVGDLLLCLPLSIFVQFTQINYEVDDLEEYISDPVKQHYLVRWLPARMKRQLLYRRKYIFAFHENLQKLVYMGLLHFGPMEKFKEKDQAIVYLKRNASIVNTVSSEPHYWLVTESPERPFERHQYTFNSAEDVESYWFDLMCICLNTPLGKEHRGETSHLCVPPGVMRIRRNVTEEEEEVAPSFVHDRHVFVGLAHMLKGSRDVCDDGSIPGDGKGAGGLHSECFGHLKRNWFWTNHLLASKARHTAADSTENRSRLKSLLSKNALRFALKAGQSPLICVCITAGSAAPRYVTAKRPLLTERIELDIEPASRNQLVVGGKGQKRKRTKKEVVKAPRKRKGNPWRQAKKRTPAHDEADHRALKMMTRQRVNWSVQEDSLIMLCRVASHLLNSKVRRPFIPYCVVRDLLHSEFEMSMDKTSVAAGRRTRYILKNPQTLLNYRISLAEVYQDKPLMKLLEEKKPANPENVEECAQVFSEYVKLLRQKFSTAPSLGDVMVPDTKGQLFERFTVLAIQSGRQMPTRDVITCTEDIHTIVLYNLIQSTLAMNNTQMKSSRSFQTFQLYSKYNQELLCKVFLQCRKRGLVNRRRVNQPFGPKKNRALPILPMSYQLSQSYYRSFSTRFPHSLFTDSFRFLKTLKNGKTDDRRQIIEFYIETSNSVSDMVPFSLDSPGGTCVASLSLMSLGMLNVHLSIPKHIVVVDSNLVDTDTVKSMAALEDEDDDEDENDEGERKILEVKAHQASHTKYLMIRGYCNPGIVKRRDLNTTDSIVVESCIVRLQLRRTPAHYLLQGEEVPPDLSKCGPSLLPPKLAFINPSSPPGAAGCESRFIQRGYTPQDLDACSQLRSSLDAAGEAGLDFQDLCRTHSGLEEPQSGRSRDLLRYLKDLQEEGQVVQVGGLAVRWVLPQHAEPWFLTLQSKRASWQPTCDQAKTQSNTRKRSRREAEREVECPVKRAAVEAGQAEQGEEPPGERKGEEEPANQEPKDGGKVMNLEEAGGRQTQEEGGEKMEPVVRGDEEEARPPAAAAPPSGADDDHTLSFISRPWRMVDGSLNRPVCKGMLEGVLCSIMSRPGVTHQALLEHFRAVLQPMALLDLLEALVDMGCVLRKTLVKSAKPSLFEDPDSVYYEPTLSCCLRLGQALPNERHWNYCLK
uniref:Uncharacterized protein n=1 Tax=Tetraodon nigroviridis TaxID=99883 RepID=H3CS41_TETNG